ncbi:uncharacterized protein LOC124454884 [Xenia sp. Carnegie-2017]|uniref:uncharacterized protein LOC124454884 n=1 Tax=Xenia sp. Carnegie-2017 TaxID=2897299 RepID=UPI001F03563B|nr:uncharacterized protein LOC124454884 [Xenia sp. Carnegie-2017]
MATESSSGAKEILSQIFNRIEELSDALASTEASSNNYASVEVHDSVENEVRKTFGQHSLSSGMEVNQSSNTTQSHCTNHASVTASSSHLATPSYNTRRYFGDQRSTMRSNRRRKCSKSKKVSTGPFSRDLILLSGPDDKNVPRQGGKVFLQENGHIISAFEFHKEWTDIDVELEIRQAFQGTLPDDVEIEIVHSVHTALLKPTLAQGQYLNGSVINRIFSNNKPVYIRPCRQILNQPTNKEKRKRYSLPENVFDDVEDDELWRLSNDSSLNEILTNNFQANQVQFGETNQATVVIDEPLKQHEAINDKQLDDAVADMINPGPSTEMQNNQCELFETNLEEPFDLQDDGDVNIDADGELYSGFINFGYFPVTLSSAFIASCLFSEDAIPKDWLVESFHQYISKDESDTLKRSISDECPDPSLDEDVADVLSSFKCRRVIKKSSMPKIIEELAHQEIIQRPKYVANAWSPILKQLKGFKQFETVESLYVTGSNIIAVDSIEVAFSDESGNARRPVAHTCAPLLIIPSTYQSYNELSEEFNNIFRREAAWSFYIV